ncbi:unnamed protein product [Lupinus luteus]|uniref:Bifunctional inhibitor/plant lipid transfer protein/seed storage helical domain-containing protein n=1 Tax=Lupinus luteus TaxID=3873 RepID=A0AAV1X563_LUPLU
MKNVLLAFLTWLAILHFVGEPGQSFSLDDATKQLLPCLTYVIGLKGNKPSNKCVNGVRALESSTPTTADRHEACKLLKAMISSLHLIKEDKANSLLQKCGVTMAFPICKDVDCQK